MSRTSMCCICGYQCPTGQDGSHSCTIVMGKTIAILEQKNEEMEFQEMNLTAGMA